VFSVRLKSGTAAWPGRAAPRVRAFGRKIARLEQDAPRRAARLAREGRQQLLLPVASDAADPQDLARAQGQGDVLQRRAFAGRRGQAEALDLQQHRPRLSPRAVDLPHRAANHHRRQLARGMGAGVAAFDHAAMAQYRGAVAMGADLVQLVADIEDRGALIGQLAQGGEEQLGLLRGQHAGRLVHDQKAGVLQEAADDLDPLPLAGRQGDDAPGGVQRQAEIAADLGDACGQFAPRRRVLHPEGDVLGHGQRVEQAEMLEHHRDARRPRGAGIVRRMGRAHQDHLPLIGPDEAVDHLDQRRLARPVLAQQRMDLARRDPEGHVVIGAHAGIGFSDAVGPEHVCRHSSLVILVRPFLTARSNLLIAPHGPSAIALFARAAIVTSSWPQIPPVSSTFAHIPSILCWKVPFR
jgi:hypothetical protein